MEVVARAPGKLVVLGEYAVLAGGTALVMAIDRYAVATIGTTAESASELRTYADVETMRTFSPGAASGVAVVDLVGDRWPAAHPRAWAARLDSRELFERGAKLGLGSSAATLCAWSGAWCAFNGLPPPTAADLIELHRALQGGGSGLDVAASRCGGAVTYAFDAPASPRIGSATLPDGVAFVAVSTGRPASTAALVSRFDDWCAHDPASATAMLDRLRVIADTGVTAAATGGPDEFLAAIEHYAAALDELGQAIGTEIMTAEHRAIAAAAKRCGVAYKVSGAGGGDVGLAFAASAAALESFRAAVPRGCRLLDLGIAREGLMIDGTAQ